MMDKDGNGFPSWRQMDDTGKGMVVMFSICGGVIVLHWIIKLSEWISG